MSSSLQPALELLDLVNLFNADRSVHVELSATVAAAKNGMRCQVAVLLQVGAIAASAANDFFAIHMRSPSLARSVCAKVFVQVVEVRLGLGFVPVAELLVREVMGAGIEVELIGALHLADLGGSRQASALVILTR